MSITVDSKCIEYCKQMLGERELGITHVSIQIDNLVKNRLNIYGHKGKPPMDWRPLIQDGISIYLPEIVWSIFEGSILSMITEIVKDHTAFSYLTPD